MPLRVSCSSCGKSLQVAESAAGNALAFSPNGRYLFSFVVPQFGGSFPKLYDVSTGKVHHTLSEKPDQRCQEVQSVAFSTDGKWVAASLGLSSNKVHVWNVETGELAQLVHVAVKPVHDDQGTPATRLAFHPNNNALAIACTDHLVHVVTISTKGETGKVGPLKTAALAFSPNGKLLATAEGNTGKVFLWDAKSCQPLAHLETGSKMWTPGLSFSADSAFLAVPVNRTIQVWELAKHGVK